MIYKIIFGGLEITKPKSQIGLNKIPLLLQILVTILFQGNGNDKI